MEVSMPIPLCRIDRVFASFAAAALALLVVDVERALAADAGAAPPACKAGGPDYSGQDLTNHNFVADPAGSLRNANFQNAKLRGAIFTGQDLTGACFNGAD